MPDRIETAPLWSRRPSPAAGSLSKSPPGLSGSAGITSWNKPARPFARRRPGHHPGAGQISSADIKTKPHPGIPHRDAGPVHGPDERGGGPVGHHRKTSLKTVHARQRAAAMGADIKLSGNTAIISGVPYLSARGHGHRSAGQRLADPGRAGRAGPDELSRVYHIDRGYEHIEQKLSGLGSAHPAHQGVEPDGRFRTIRCGILPPAYRPALGRRAAFHFLAGTAASFPRLRVPWRSPRGRPKWPIHRAASRRRPGGHHGDVIGMTAAHPGRKGLHAVHRPAHTIFWAGPGGPDRSRAGPVSCATAAASPTASANWWMKTIRSWPGPTPIWSRPNSSPNPAEAGGEAGDLNISAGLCKNDCWDEEKHYS